MAAKFIFPLYNLFLLHRFPLHSLASSSGTLALFLDEECSQASIINPSINVPLDTCLVTAGALGIAVETLPNCTAGDATLILYRDTSCGNLVDSGIQYNNCYFDGPDGVPAVIFACTEAAGGKAATATSTVSAGLSSIPVAADTPTTTSSGGTSEQTTPSSNGATTTSTAPSSSISSNSSRTSTNGGGTGSGISQNGQIALSVVLPVATLVVALLTWWFPCKRKGWKRTGTQHQTDQYGLMHHPSQGLTPSAMGRSTGDASVQELADTGYGVGHQGPGYFGAQGHVERPWHMGWQHHGRV